MWRLIAWTNICPRFYVVIGRRVLKLIGIAIIVEIGAKRAIEIENCNSLEQNIGKREKKYIKFGQPHEKINNTATGASYRQSITVRNQTPGKRPSTNNHWGTPLMNFKSNKNDYLCILNTQNCVKQSTLINATIMHQRDKKMYKVRCIFLITTPLQILTKKKCKKNQSNPKVKAKAKKSRNGGTRHRIFLWDLLKTIQPQSKNCNYH